MRMVGMKFRDIPQHRWFQDGGGRRMIKMQESNGACNFHYLGYAIPKTFGCENAALSACMGELEQGFMRENTNQPVFVRSVNGERVIFNGFNAVDDKGIMCRCPLDVEFYVEKEGSAEATIQTLRARIDELTDKLFSLEDE